MKVFLNAGHGGIDSGAIYGNYIEKDLTLDFTKILKEKFEKQGIEVITSRLDDRSITLNQVCFEENESKSNCFISIHFNSCKEPNTATGEMIFLHSKAPQNYVDWANDIVNNIDMTSNRSISVVKGTFSGGDMQVNRATKSPSMLIELGFINSDINMQEYRQNKNDYADVIVKATCKFLNVEYNPNGIKTTNCDVLYEKISRLEFENQNLKTVLNKIKAIVNEVK